jgi:hypothetical protein
MMKKAFKEVIFRDAFPRSMFEGMHSNPQQP